MCARTHILIRCQDPDVAELARARTLLTYEIPAGAATGIRGDEKHLARESERERERGRIFLVFCRARPRKPGATLLADLSSSGEFARASE